MKHTPLRVLATIVISMLPAMAQESATIKAIPALPNGIIDEQLTGKQEGQPVGGRGAFVLSTDTVFPHLALGGGWETILVLVNLGTSTVNFQQSFYSQSGAPMTVTFRTVPQGVVTTTSALQGTLPPRQSFNILLWDSSQDVKIGWSSINYDTTNARLGGYAIFRQRVQGRPDFEALVPLSSYDDTVFFMPFDNLENFVTSMALLNPGSNFTTDVTATVYDDNGNQLATSVISLAPGNQTAFAIPDRFPSTRNRVGTIMFRGSTTRLSALGFRFNAGGAFATIPILNWSAMFQ